MGSNDRTPPGPRILWPQQYCQGVMPAERMLLRDLRLQPKFTAPYWTPGPPWAPIAGPGVQLSPQQMSEADIQALRDYVQGLPANLMVPPATPPAPPPAEAESPWSFSGPSRGSEDGGVGHEWKGGVREYLGSGYTRRNPDGTYEVDNDFGGKFEDGFTIAEAEYEFGSFDRALASGEFGNPGDFFTGNGSAFGAAGDAKAGFELTNEGLTSSAAASAGVHALKGEIASNPDAAVAGKAEGSVLAAEAEAKAEAVMTAEQVTLGGKLGASANLIEGELSGDIYITPRRIGNVGINAWNWIANDDVGLIDEAWDIGITLGGEVSASAGAQAEAEARAGYEKGSMRAEAGVKLGLGVGAGVKARGGLVGLDKVWNWIWGE